MNGGSYSAEWCQEKHRIIEERLNKLEARIWTIILLLVGNLAGVVTLLL
jgi:hypothetical protein